MNEKLYLVETVSPTAVAGASNRNRIRNIIVLGIAALLLVALAFSQLQATGGISAESNSAVVDPAPVTNDDEFSYYTERYWITATREAPTAATAEPEEDYAYYTERYWKSAETDAAESAVPAEDAATTEPDYAYYTERYWKSDGNSVADEEEDYAYYTERYWRQAEER